MKKTILLFALALLPVLSLSAQSSASSPTATGEPGSHGFPMLGKAGIFNQLEVGGVIGTTGLGLEVAAPLTEWIKVRAGVDWVPPVKVPMHFNIQAYTIGDGGVVNTGNFGRVQEIMGELGYDIDQTVDVDAHPRMTTFKFLVDVYPFRHNRHWRFTAGFYAGGRNIGRAVNSIDEAPSLVVMGIYNKLYEYVMTTDFVETPVYNDVYLDPDMADKLKEKFSETGRLAVHMGDFVKNGQPYMMEPGRDGQVKANAYVNAIRPYLGAGYQGALSRDCRWQLGVDLGAQLWGGSPDIVTHEGVDMTNQLRDVPGKVGKYLRWIKRLKVYPTLAVKISYTFF